MSYWKTKVLPKLKKFLDKGGKKAASAFTKKFETQKEAYGTEIDEKKDTLQPKVVEIYKASTPETQDILKEPTEEKIKAKPGAASALLVELGKAGVPGAKLVGEVASKLGAGALPEPVLFLLNKVTPFVADEPAPVLPTPEPAPAAEKVEETTREVEITATPSADAAPVEPATATPDTTPAPPAEVKVEPKTEAAAPPAEPEPKSTPEPPPTTPDVPAPTETAPPAPAPAPTEPAPAPPATETKPAAPSS